MNYNFPLLKADQIEVRVGQVMKSGYTLLLYKTARTDAKVLDEVVGQGNWQNKFYSVKDSMICSIGIWDEDKKSWIWKDDAGDETQVEKVKGEASDSFKRAGFKWGIGRELYETGFLFVSGGTKLDGNKYVLDDEHKYQRPVVSSIEWNENPLSLKKLVIMDENTGNLILKKGVKDYEKKVENKPQETPKVEVKVNKPNPDQTLLELCNKEKGSITESQIEYINNFLNTLTSEKQANFRATISLDYHVNNIEELSEYHAQHFISRVEQAKSRR